MALMAAWREINNGISQWLMKAMRSVMAYMAGGGEKP
jgi:hypothetical protein